MFDTPWFFIPKFNTFEHRDIVLFHILHGGQVSFMERDVNSYSVGKQ